MVNEQTWYFLANLLPQLATIGIGVMYLPQIFHLYKTKDVGGISLWFWVILSGVLTINVTNAFVVYRLTGIYGAIITQGVNLVMAVIVLTQVGYYKRKKKEENQ